MIVLQIAMEHRRDRAAVPIAAFALLALGLATALAASTAALASGRVAVPAEPALVAGTESRLTTRQLVGQRVIWSYAGTAPPRRAAHADRPRGGRRT